MRLAVTESFAATNLKLLYFYRIMNKRMLFIFATVVLILLASVIFNIYIVMKNNELEAKQKAFIPAALSLEQENNRLLEKEKMQQQSLDDLVFFKDSILNVLSKTASPDQKNTMLPPSSNTMNQMDPLQQQQPAVQQPNTGNTFKDLNKGIE
jgi:hypothetical protein